MGGLRSINSKNRLIASVVVALLAAFSLGRLSVHWPRYYWLDSIQLGDIVGDPKATLRDEEHDFAQIVDAWNREIQTNDGYLPTDPYKFLATEADVPWARLPTFEFARHAPVRLNTKLSLNPKWPIFCFQMDHDFLSEDWVCYADGTWARLPRGYGNADWYAPLKKAGYPLDEWRTWKAKAKWSEANESRLVWDGTKRLYIVR